MMYQENRIQLPTLWKISKLSTRHNSPPPDVSLAPPCYVKWACAPTTNHKLKCWPLALVISDQDTVILDKTCWWDIIQECMSDLGGATNRTQQLGGISHSGSAVTEGRGELGCLGEVMLLVLGRLVDNTCEHKEQDWDLTGDYILVLYVKLQYIYVLI